MSEATETPIAEAPKSLKRKAAKGVTWSAVEQWGRQGVNFVVILILSRLLDPKAFGFLAAGLAYTAFAEIFVEQGFAHAIIQRADLEPGHKNAAFWGNLAIGILITILGFLGAPWIASFFRVAELTPVMRWLSLFFLLHALSETQQALLQRQLAFRSLSIRTLIATLAGGIVGISLAVLGYGVWSLVALTLVEKSVNVLLLWFASDWRPGLQMSWRHYRELFAFGINIMLASFLGYINRRSDNLVVARFLGPIALGYYTLAYQFLPVALQLLAGITSVVAYPVLSRLQGDMERMRRVYYQATQLTGFVAFPIFIGMSLVAREIILSFNGAKWLPSVPVLQVLSLSGILLSLHLFNGTVLKAGGRPQWALWIAIMNAVSNLTGFLIAVRWGIVAVAAAYVIRGYVLAPVTYLAVHRLIQLDFRLYFRQLRGTLIGTLLMTAMVLALRLFLQAHLPVQVALGLYILAGGATYLLALRLLEPALVREFVHYVQMALPERRKQAGT